MIRAPRKVDGQALVEFAYTVSLFLVVVFVIIQFGMIFVWYFSTTQLTRTSARWLAVNASTAVDADVAERIRNTALFGMATAPPVLVSSGFGGTPTVYSIGAITARFTACEPRSAPQTGCGNGARASGETVFVELEYDATHILFFPAGVRIGPYSAAVPTSLPVYRVWIMAE